MNLFRLQRNFETLAAADPWWTVLSDETKKDGKWDEEEFYQTGERAIRSIETSLGRHGITLGGGRALDFGCGVGRLTFPLSRRFEQTVGVDISISMLKEAKRNAHRGNHCQFILNTDSTLNFLASESLDFAFSDIVFQHIAPRYSKRYFVEIARSLKPGGIFAFQLPSHLKRGSLCRKRLSYQLKGLAQRLGLGTAYYEMNAIPRTRLVKYLEQRTALRLVKHWDYPAAGPRWQSYLYVFRKT